MQKKVSSWFGKGAGFVRRAAMPASIAARCAGRAAIGADMQGEDIVAGTGIAGIGEASMLTRISTAFRMATTIIPTGRAATLACLGAQNGIADAYGTGDMATATTEVACVTTVAAHVEWAGHRKVPSHWKAEEGAVGRYLRRADSSFAIQHF